MFFLFHCDYYNVKDLSSQFYNELLQWRVDFQNNFSAEKPWHNIIWNDKYVHIKDRPVFVKTFSQSLGFAYATDLLIDLNTTESYNMISTKIKKINLLV